MLMERGERTRYTFDNNIQMGPASKSSHLDLQGGSSEEMHGQSPTEQKARGLAETEAPAFLAIG